jgi:hypothetical protein
LKDNFDHQLKSIPKKEASKILPWVHNATSNAKSVILDAHHRIDDDFLQDYLNAYVFKLNRRYFKILFDNALIAAGNNQWNYLEKKSISINFDLIYVAAIQI